MKITRVPIPRVEVSLAPNLVDFLAMECSEILEIFDDKVGLSSPRYFDTENHQFLVIKKS